MIGHDVEARLCLGIENAVSVSNGGGQRLFDEDVAAVLEGQDGLLGVQVIGPSDRDDVGLDLVEQRLVVRPGKGLWVELLRSLDLSL